MVKWFVAFLGYYFFRFPGALFGFFIGSLIDQLNKNSSSSFQSWVSTSSKSKTFQLNLLALSATVIKADGKIKTEELQFVRNFISNYGTQQASIIFETFNEQIKNEVQNIQKLAKIFVESSPYETRLQVLYFLFGVAKADGSVSQSELSKIDQIASALGIRISDFESIKAMFFEDSDSAYKILEISPNVSDSEVKKLIEKWPKNITLINYNQRILHLSRELKKNFKRYKKHMKQFKMREVYD